MPMFLNKRKHTIRKTGANHEHNPIHQVGVGWPEAARASSPRGARESLIFRYPAAIPIKNSRECGCLSTDPERVCGFRVRILTTASVMLKCRIGSFPDAYWHCRVRIPTTASVMLKCRILRRSRSESSCSRGAGSGPRARSGGHARGRGPSPCRPRRGCGTHRRPGHTGGSTRSAGGR